MIFLCIILGILALVLLLLLAYLRVAFSYRDGDFSLYVCVGPIRYKVPQEKKPHYRALAKQLRGQKLSKFSEKQKEKQTKKEKNSALDELRGDLPMPEFLGKIKDILLRLAARYAKKLHITVKRLYITVGTGEPASTGIAYGVTVQNASYLLEFLDYTVTLAPLEKDAVEIRADFSGTWNADIRVTIKIRTIHLLQASLSAFFMLKRTLPQENMKV